MNFKLDIVRDKELNQYKADMPEDFIGDGGEGMFIFRKEM